MNRIDEEEIRESLNSLNSGKIQIEHAYPLERSIPYNIEVFIKNLSSNEFISIFESGLRILRTISYFPGIHTDRIIWGVCDILAHASKVFQKQMDNMGRCYLALQDEGRFGKSP